MFKFIKDTPLLEQTGDIDNYQDFINKMKPTVDKFIDEYQNALRNNDQKILFHLLKYLNQDIEYQKEVMITLKEHQNEYQDVINDLIQK